MYWVSLETSNIELLIERAVMLGLQEVDSE